MNDSAHQLLIRLKALADMGLLYANNNYDKERYEEIEQISYKLLHHFTGADIESLKASFLPAKDYPTAKVDLRALILSNDQKILMVQEQQDGKWSLPGGWADIGFSPSENIIKECKEETGLDVYIKKLLAVFDKKKHSHPPQNLYVYKMIFHCVATSNEIKLGFDVLDAQYFDIDDLPTLSENRILASQIKLAYEKILKGEEAVYFD